MLYYIAKLFKLPVRISHLEDTGIGVTVNNLRKLNGKISDAAKSLISKWKKMVVEETDKSSSDSPSKKGEKLF